MDLRLIMASSEASCAHCGKQRKALKRCSVCRREWYCGAECQKAGWKKHRRTCLGLEQIREKVFAAEEACDWRGLLEWEGRLDELLEGQPNDHLLLLLNAFGEAHDHMAKESNSLGEGDHAVSAVSILKRRIVCLGKMQLFRYQGESMCHLADRLLILGRVDEASELFAAARAVGAAHGFFTVECLACAGLGGIAAAEGCSEEALDLLRNALAAVPKP